MKTNPSGFCIGQLRWTIFITIPERKPTKVQYTPWLRFKLHYDWSVQRWYNELRCPVLKLQLQLQITIKQASPTGVPKIQSSPILRMCVQHTSNIHGECCHNWNPLHCHAKDRSHALEELKNGNRGTTEETSRTWREHMNATDSGSSPADLDSAKMLFPLQLSWGLQGVILVGVLVKYSINDIWHL